MSVLMKEVCKLLKIQKLQTSSYNAQANGIWERMHFVNKDARNWDKYVPYAVMAYGVTPHCSVKYSPDYLVYGRELRLPIEDDWKPTRREEGDYNRHVSELAMRLYEANKEARNQSKLVMKLLRNMIGKLVRFY